MVKIFRLWIGILLVYSILMFFLGTPALPFVFVVPFYLFIPGYALVEVFFAHRRKLEKVVMSMGLSLGLLVGIRVLKDMRVLGLTRPISEHTLLAIFSVVCLIVKLFQRK